jgi:hypothetical protein
LKPSFDPAPQALFWNCHGPTVCVYAPPSLPTTSRTPPSCGTNRCVLIGCVVVVVSRHHGPSGTQGRLAAGMQVSPLK